MRSRVRRIQFKGVADSRDTALPLLSDTGDVAVINRGRPRFIVIRCPCGCGENLFANLDRRAGPAWRLYHKRNKLTLFPSYWREDACESHFILWNDRIFWCDFEEDGDDLWSVDSSIEESVLKILSHDEFIKYATIADQLDLIPWEALQACRQLESKGLVAGEKDLWSVAFRRTARPRK
jgi:Family of unknown function (DUF6527)